MSFQSQKKFNKECIFKQTKFSYKTTGKKEGSHAPCVYLDIRTTLGLDVCEYPDSGKVNILPTLEVFEKSSKTDYFKGEEAVRDQWPEQILKASE